MESEEELEVPINEGETSFGESGLPAEPTGAEEGCREEGSMVKRALKGRKTKNPQPSTSEDAEYDDMYFSPLDSSSELFFVGLLVVLLASIWTRLHRIAEPDHVA